MHRQVGRSAPVLRRIRACPIPSNRLTGLSKSFSFETRRRKPRGVLGPQRWRGRMWFRRGSG